MIATKEEMKAKAIELMNKIGFYHSFVDLLKNQDKKYLFYDFDCCSISNEPKLVKKIKEIEEKYGLLVYAVTYELMEFGECYSLLVIPKYKEDWELLFDEYSKDIKSVFAYVWNKTDDNCSEFGRVLIKNIGGFIKRIG